MLKVTSFFTRIYSKVKNKENEISLVSSLAPKILTDEKDIEKVQPYLSKLNETLNAKGINNIAVTGGYGSGKSTIIKTFQHFNKKKYNFLNISLAAFNQSKTKENFKELYDFKIKNGKTIEEAEKEITKEFKETITNKEELERQLEISILQQIVYKVKPSNLSESRFKRIVNISKWKLWLFIPTGFILWISSLVLLFKYDYLDRLNPNTWTYKINNIDWSTLIIFLLAFLGIGYFSKLIVTLFSNSKINKVNLKGEIEIGDNSNKSILNEHYDEILYYFEKNHFNVIVIEDLDRFDNTNIFTKLRELNILLNNADTLKNKKPYKKFGIKFLYAVGDGLFCDKKERVKFFEYIIPIIPFINSSNAEDQLKTLIKDSKLDKNIFSQEFISDITTFIDDIDMRLLINIFQEFVVYRNILKSEFVKKPEQLFAIITYKNLEPEDFDKLNNKEGKLYKLINDKKLYVIALLDKKQKDILDKSQELDNIIKESIDKIEELKPVYLFQLAKKIPDAIEFYVLDNKRKLGELIDDDLFDEITKTTDFQYYRNSYGAYSSGFSFQDIESEVDANFSYGDRVELIESKNNGSIEILQKEIEKLRTEKTEIENWDLKQIFREVDINKYLDNFTNNGLLRNLILEGYINENYNDYISLFHEVSITKEDFEFERNVKSGINSDYYYKLTEIKNLVDKIDLKYFERESILNFDLVNFLAENYDTYLNKYNSIIKLLLNEKESSTKFIDDYVHHNRYREPDILGKEFLESEYIQESIRQTNETNEIHLKIFFEALVHYWKNFWSFVYNGSNYSSTKKDNYLYSIMKYAQIDDILNTQNKKIIGESIEKNSGFLQLVKNIDLMKIKKMLIELNVKFDKIDEPNNDVKELFDFVYKNNHYKINKANILQMILFFGVDKEYILSNIEKSNYYTIRQSKCEELIKYINTHINTYIDNVYLRLDLNKNENEESLIDLLKNENLFIQNKDNIIQQVETKISNLNSIVNKEIKSILLIRNKVLPTWNNVIEYYKMSENKIDESLIKYLNFENVYSSLSKEKMPHNSDKFDYISFRGNLLLCNDLSDESYTHILESSIYTMNSLLFIDLDNTKILYLVDKILMMSKENYDLLKTNFSPLHITLIEKHFSEFISKIDKIETDETDVTMILDSSKISLDNKFKYISNVDESIIVKNKEISKIVGEIILQKSKIIEFEKDTLKSIVINLKSEESKVKFINLNFEKLSNEAIVVLVSNISWDYKELFVKKHRPTFNDTAYNQELLKKLLSKKLILRFDPDKKDSTKIRAIANS